MVTRDRTTSRALQPHDECSRTRERQGGEGDEGGGGGGRTRGTSDHSAGLPALLDVILEDRDALEVDVAAKARAAPLLPQRPMYAADSRLLPSSPQDPDLNTTKNSKPSSVSKAPRDKERCPCLAGKVRGGKEVLSTQHGSDVICLLTRRCAEGTRETRWRGPRRSGGARSGAAGAEAGSCSAACPSRTRPAPPCRAWAPRAHEPRQRSAAARGWRCSSATPCAAAEHVQQQWGTLG